MMTKKIRIIIVDDHGLVREGFQTILSKIDEIEVLDSVASGEEAITATTRMQPDVVLMDIVMPGMSGIEATRWIKEQNPNVKVILVSGEVNDDLIRQGLKAGLDGYIHKDSSMDDVLTALRQVLLGQRHLGKEITEVVLRGLEDGGREWPNIKRSTELTKREKEILKLIASGKSIKEIAEDLFISARTVETHKLNIQAKLNLTNTAQLVRYAIKRKMV